VSDPVINDRVRELDPVQARQREGREGRWTARLVLFLRVIAGLSMLKGLYHWAAICGIGAGPDDGFDARSLAWQTATVFFAVFDLVAAVGLWLAAPWGAVVWLTSAVSMAAVELFFPAVFGGSMIVVVAELILLASYLFLAIQSAREHPHG
jgi:hypothetical protein